MVKNSRYACINECEKDSDLTEFLFDEEEPGVVYEDVPDEDAFPPGWEDLLYESWRDQQKNKQTEDRNEIS